MMRARAERREERRNAAVWGSRGERVESRCWWVTWRILTVGREEEGEEGGM